MDNADFSDVDLGPTHEVEQQIERTGETIELDPVTKIQLFAFTAKHRDRRLIISWDQARARPCLPPPHRHSASEARQIHQHLCHGPGW